jgi:hypothetical protein
MKVPYPLIADLVEPVLKKIITVTPIVLALSAVTVGTAAADDYSHSSPGSVLVNVAQIDNPTEDVLDHTLNFGDGYKRD